MLAAWSRSAHLGQSLWLDEITSVTHYINPGPTAVWRDYIPNDHLFFNQTAWAFTELFGRGEAVYRLPCVIASLAGLVVVTRALWSRNRIVASTALLVLVTSPVHLSLSRQARGYGFLFLAAAGLLVGGVWIAEGRRWGVVIFSAAGLFGIMSLPIFSLPYLSSVVALLWDRATRRIAVLSVAIVGVMSVAYLAPVVRDLRPGPGQRVGNELSISAPITGWVEDLMKPSVDLAIPCIDIGGNCRPRATDGLRYVLLATLVLLGGMQLVHEGRRAQLRLLMCPVVGTYGGLWLLHAQVVPRFTSYLLVPLAVLIGYGVVGALRLVANSRARLVVSGALGIVAVVTVAQFSSLANRETRLPVENYAAMADIVADAPSLPVFAAINPQSQVGLDYYLSRPYTQEFPAALERRFCARERLIFIDYPFFSLPIDLSCLEREGVRRIDIPQLGLPGCCHSTITVWIADGT